MVLEMAEGVVVDSRDTAWDTYHYMYILQHTVYSWSSRRLIAVRRASDM